MKEVGAFDDVLQRLKNIRAPVRRELRSENVGAIQTGTLGEEEQAWLLQLVRLFPRLFAENPKKPPVTSAVEHNIDTGDHKPIQRRWLRYSPKESELIESEIKEMLKNDVIELSSGAWGFPVVLGAVRLVQRAGDIPADDGHDTAVDLVALLSVYLDDVNVFTRGTFARHLVHLAEVFGLLESAGLSLKREKCHFGQAQVGYLGHVLSKAGVQPVGRLVKAVKEFPPPRGADVQWVRRFVHLVGFYRKFIENFSRVAAPLTRLTQKDQPWMWGNEQQAAYETLKAKLVSAPVLRYPDFTKECLLAIDAVSRWLRGALMQEDDEKRCARWLLSRRRLRMPNGSVR
ncbi:hypothetical protein Gpo141_00012622 [Globisporangium polare]